MKRLKLPDFSGRRAGSQESAPPALALSGRVQSTPGPEAQARPTCHGSGEKAVGGHSGDTELLAVRRLAGK